MRTLTLRPYQHKDSEYLSSLPAAGVFNEQRTGKTPTSIRAAVAQGAQKILMIVPSSLVYPWMDEFTEWTGLPCTLCEGTAKQREQALEEWTHGLVISYAQLRAMVARDQYGRATHFVKESMSDKILKHKPDAVILDEAHRIKDYNSASAKAVFRFCRVPYRLALTGTPAPNYQYEIYSILHFLYKDSFNSYWKFIDDWFECGVMFLKHGQVRVPGKLKAGKEKAFQEMLDKISIMRKRDDPDVMPWLPPRCVPDRVRLPLTEEQRRYLSELHEFYETEDIITHGILDRLIRERQICNAPELLGLKGKSPKIEWLKSYVADYPDRPTVIFSKFKGFIQLIQKAIPGTAIITGDTPKDERHRLISDFQSGKITLLAGQIDTLKEGVTLDRAECEIFMDQIPPASDVSQARDRFIATNEKMAMIPKQIIDVMMADSYDEVLVEMVALNKELTDVINDYKNFLKGGK